MFTNPGFSSLMKHLFCTYGDGFQTVFSFKFYNSDVYSAILMIMADISAFSVSERRTVRSRLKMYASGI